MVKVLYVAMKYDYGIKERGFSFEHTNFFDCLDHLGLDFTYFDFMSVMQERGKKGMNQLLLKTVKEEKPDLMFCVLFKEEIERGTLRAITEDTETTTVNWFCDDHWRFDDFSSQYAPCFDYVVTTARSALQKYEALGYKNVIKSQWACNPFTYRKLDLPLAYDMTFVGQPHGNRREVMASIRAAGINTKTWGNGWEEGRVDQEQMIHIFNQSRINLNLSNASRPTGGRQDQFKRFAWTAGKYVRRMPGGDAMVSRLKKVAARIDTPSKNTVRTAKTSPRYVEQIKGRNFEVPGCGGFVLTSSVEELDKYYRIGREVVCYDTIPELIEKARYYLRNEEERKVVADAGYRRTMKEHTYVHRFKDIFQRISLPYRDLDVVLDEYSGRGHDETESLT